jgi:hypothetical protein
MNNITIGDIEYYFDGTMAIVGTGITNNKKLFVVVQIGNDTGELADAVRTKVREHLAELPFVDERVILAFFGEPEKEARPGADEDEESAADPAGVDEVRAAGFVVLVLEKYGKPTIRHAFLCVEGLAPPDETPGSTDDAPGSTDDAPGSTDDAPGSTDDAPGSTDDAPGSTDDAPGSTDDAPGSTDDAPGSTDDAPGSTDDAPGSTDDAPGSTDDAPGSTDDAPGSTDDAPGSTDDTPGSTDDGHQCFIFGATVRTDDDGTVRTDDDGTLPTALLAASQCFGGGPYEPELHFVAPASDTDKVAALSPISRVSATFTCGEGPEALSFAIVSLRF